MTFEKVDNETIVEVKQVEMRQTFNVRELKAKRAGYLQKRAIIVANYPVELARIDEEIAALDARLAEAAKLGITLDSVAVGEKLP